MKTIIWIEKNRDLVEIWIERFNFSEKINVITFFSYREALIYLRNQENRVDLIISNYSEFFWADILFSGLRWKDLPTAFDFFDETLIVRSGIPFILFSSMLIENTDLKKMSVHKNFHYVHKNNFEEMEALIHLLIG